MCFLASQPRNNDEKIKKATSQTLGQTGNRTQILKSVVNFKAMPTVPDTQAIIRQSSSSSRQDLCIIIMSHLSSQLAWTPTLVLNSNI